MSCFCSVGNTTASDAEGGGAAILVDIAHCDTVRIAFLDALGEGECVYLSADGARQVAKNLVEAAERTGH
jgi:hypothetical protein